MPLTMFAPGGGTASTSQALELLLPVLKDVRAKGTLTPDGRRTDRLRLSDKTSSVYGRRRAATPEPAESPVPGSSAPAAPPTPGSSAPVAAPTPGSPAPAAAPTPDSTAPAAAPAPGSSAPVAAPTPGSSVPAAAPTPGSTAPAAAPAPGSSAPAAAPTPGSSVPAAAPTPGSAAPAAAPAAPGSVTPGAPLRRVQRHSYHSRICSREGSSRLGGEALAPAPVVRLAPEVPLLRLQY
ncbi:unnamed protein product, partial [Closterium sp. NIES-53]